MIQIKIKIRDGLANEIEQRLQKALGKGMKKLVTKAYEEWQAEAGRKLTTTRRAYQDALKLTITNDDKATIELAPRDPKNQWLIRALEMGWPAFDLKPGRLGKRNRPAYYWSEHAKPATGGKGPGAKKKPGQPFYQEVPFVDIPFFKKGTKEGAPEKFRRMHKGGSAWRHPGFKPKGSGGPGPMRPHVVEFIKEQAPKILQSEVDKEFSGGVK